MMQLIITGGLAMESHKLLYLDELFLFFTCGLQSQGCVFPAGGVQEFD